MFIKMKESKGFTLIELMIVVAIIGILAAVAIPFYQRYIQKSRLTSKVFPGMHIIETNVGNIFSFRGTEVWGGGLLSGATWTDILSDADTRCFDATYTAASKSIRFVLLAKAAGKCTELQSMWGKTIYAAPTVRNNKITGWVLSGSVANLLGLRGEK